MRYLSFIVSLLLTTSIFAQQKKGEFTVSGFVSGQDTGTISLGYMGQDDKWLTAHAPLINGHFSFKGLINEPTRAVLTGKTKSTFIDDPNFTEFFLTASQINVKLVKDSFKNAIVTGSATENEAAALKKKKAAINAEMAPLEKELSANLDSMDKDRKNKIFQENHTAIIKQFQPFYARLRNIDYQFIVANPTSYVNPYLLSDDLRYLPIDSVQLLYNGFEPNVKASIMGRFINRFINGFPGSVVKDFTTKDVNGKLISLSAFKNKSYVLLDFWATYCGPCRSNSPHLVEIYNKYHAKGLEVIGIANDDQRVAAWKKAMIDDKTTVFHQVLQGVGTPNDIGEQFAIQGIPAKILIDKNGKIVYRHDDDDDILLDQKLAEIFN